MNFLKFFGLSLIVLLVITLPAIYFISGSLDLGTILRVTIPFVLAIAVVYFISFKNKKAA